MVSKTSVSYTHLDVYKRQVQKHTYNRNTRWLLNARMVSDGFFMEYKNMPGQDLKNVHYDVHTSTQTARSCLCTIQSE